MKYIVIVYDADNATYNRSPITSSANVTYATRVPRFDINEHPAQNYEGWFLCESKEFADAQAEALAKKYPGKTVKVAEITHEFQSEIPKVVKKIVSSKGVLPG